MNRYVSSMRFIKTISLLFVVYCVIGQPPSNRYTSEIFDFTVTNDVLFSSGVPQPNEGGGFYEFITGYPLNVDEYDTSPVDLYMDIYEPMGDSLANRPLVIVAFGGGFLSGSRDHWSIKLICEDLAKRGFVAASIDYRLGMNIFDSDLANRAVYRGLQDGRAAVRFFRADASGGDTYRIDPDHIYIGGHSSGGFIGLHNAYLDTEVERPLSTYEWVQDGNYVADLGCLDCAGQNVSSDGHANGVFNLAGAIGFTSFIESSDDPEVVMFHSSDDGTVPYDSGEPFSSLLWLVVGSDLPVVYGSLEIALRAFDVNLPFTFYSYSNRGHGVHEDGDSDLYTDIVPGIGQWFYDRELKPNYDDILGDAIVCDNGLVQSYGLDEGEGVYFDWKVEGGDFDAMSAYLPVVDLTWDTMENFQHVSVIPYNRFDARGDSIHLTISIQENVINTFLDTSPVWNDLLNWSEGHIPLECEDVMLATSGITDVILDTDAVINTLEIGPATNLTNSAHLTIYQKVNKEVIRPLTVNGQLINQSLIEILLDSSTQDVLLSNDAVLINAGDLVLKNEIGN